MRKKKVIYQVAPSLQVIIKFCMLIKFNSKQNLLEKKFTGEFLALRSPSKHNSLAHKLGKMSGKCSLIIFANMMIMFVKSENNGNTLVNCAACQSVQVQDWSCDVNCHIIKGTNGKYRCHCQVVKGSNLVSIAVNCQVAK